MEMSLPTVLIIDMFDNQTGECKTKDRRDVGEGTVVGDFVEFEFLREGGGGAEVREEFVVVDAEEVLSG